MSEHEDEDRPLLLHSLAEFAPLIRPVLDAVTPRRIVEVGGEGGALTTLLADWADANEATVACVDPAPSVALSALGRSGRVELVEAKSPAVLVELEPFDLYILDGDHNHYVVSRELEVIFGDARRTPVTLMHDVGWPAARRDQYYDPADVPEPFRRPYDYEAGTVVDERLLVAGSGFHGAGAFAYATDEGGPGNGVLTAVDDLLAERDDLEFRRVPAVFGFGVLFGRDDPTAPRLRAILDPFHEHELLARMEHNRLQLYLEVIDRRRRLDTIGRVAREHIEALERELEAAHAELAVLRRQGATSD